MEKLLDGIEAGGTKFVCAVENNGNRWEGQLSNDDSRRNNVLVIDFFKQYEEQLVSIGVDSFG